jgi:hypothetical protein
MTGHGARLLRHLLSSIRHFWGMSFRSVGGQPVPAIRIRDAGRR